MHKARPNQNSAEQLSDMEQRFLELYMTGQHSQFQCLVMAGYARTTALTQAKRIRLRPRVRRAIIVERIRRGLYVSAAERRLVGKVENVG